MNLFFWTLLNLVVPVVGPVFTLALVAPTHGRRVAQTLIAASVRNGQLFWCAIGLSAAAIYEGLSALQQGKGAAPVLQLGIVGLCVLAFACSICVMSGTIKTGCGEGMATAPGSRHIVINASLSRAAMGLSVCATAVTVSLFAFLHIYLN